MDFASLVSKVRKQKGLEPIEDNYITLCFDPGHTTGWAAYTGAELTGSGEIDTTSIETAVSSIVDLMVGSICYPDAVVIEDYRVYKWRAKHHAGSDMLTTRVIGCIETICVQKFVDPIVKQPAHIAKTFCTDKKLRAWDMHRTGKHARDAIRHGCYFLIFGAIQKKDKARLTVG